MTFIDRIKYKHYKEILICRPHHTSSNGYRYYSHEQLNQVMNIKPNLDRITIGYCRVSSNKQKDDLERQIDNMKLYLTAQGKPFEIISDIGSGINYKKKKDCRNKFRY